MAAKRGGFVEDDLQQVSQGPLYGGLPPDTQRTWEAIVIYASCQVATATAVQASRRRRRRRRCGRYRTPGATPSCDEQERRASAAAAVVWSRPGYVTASGAATPGTWAGKTARRCTVLGSVLFSSSSSSSSVWCFGVAAEAVGGMCGAAVAPALLVCSPLAPADRLGSQPPALAYTTDENIGCITGGPANRQIYTAIYILLHIYIYILQPHARGIYTYKHICGHAFTIHMYLLYTQLWYTVM